jgi:aminopeptidase S
MIRRGLALLVFLLFAPTALPQQETKIRETVSAIAQGADGAARRQAITNRLDAAGVEYVLEEFTNRTGRMGTNVVATVGSGSPKILLLGAHLDRVAAGQGVLDNGASCAVLVHLLEAFKARPMRNYTLQVAFFDLEEAGLNGSQAFFEPVRNGSKPAPAFAANLDIFGYGDTFFTTASHETGPLTKAFQQAAMDSGLSVRFSPIAQYPASDHRTMMSAGIETLGIALIDGKEVDAVLGRGQPSAGPPRVLTIIHSPRVILEVLNLPEIEKAAQALERFIRLLDGN